MTFHLLTRHEQALFTYACCCFLCYTPPESSCIDCYIACLTIPFLVLLLTNPLRTHHPPAIRPAYAKCKQQISATFLSHPGKCTTTHSSLLIARSLVVGLASAGLVLPSYLLEPLTLEEPLNIHCTTTSPRSLHCYQPTLSLTALVSQQTCARHTFFPNTRH